MARGVRVAIGAALVAGVGAIAWWCAVAFTDQMNNTIRLQFCARQLAREHARVGAYPPSFACVDYWGRPAKYVALGEKFTLVSYGRDGRPDPESEIRVARHPARQSTCFRPNKGTVVDEGGVVEGCFK